MEQKPERKYLKLRVENNRTYEVRDFHLAEFIAAVEKRKPPEGLEASRSSAEPVDANLYPVPDNSTFLESVVANLKKFKPAMDKEKKNSTCDKKPHKEKFAHQDVLAAYFNVQNPYRGILIYHGMGSGKTCSSVAMAENLAGNKKTIWILTPAALESNYRSEMVKCSNIYKQSQHWVSRKEGWVVLKGRPPNFDELGPKEQQEVGAHLKQLIERENAYKFVSYSGINCQNIRAQFSEANPFENAVVVIDEVHLLVELISNNMANIGSPYPLLYEWLMDAEGCRLIALSGTPRANKLTDLGILYNMVYGYIKVWKVHTPKLIEDAKLKRFIHQQHSDGKLLEVTRTPNGFEAKYDETSGALLGLHRVDDTWDDHKFKTELLKHGRVDDKVDNHKLLPDRAEDPFVPEDVFQRRIRGLTSYFPDLGKLMPKMLAQRIHDVPLSDLQAKEPNVFNLHFPNDVPRIVRKPLDACQTTSAEDPKYLEDIRKTIAQLREKQVFDKLEVYGPKLKDVVKNVSAATSRQLVYTAELENAFFFAEALANNGFSKLVLTPPNPPEQMTWAVVPSKDPTKTFILYTGSSAELELYVSTFNNDGARIMLTSAAMVEGISLGDVSDVHLMEPSSDPTKLMQVVGRARRMCKNKSVEGVTPHLYISGKGEKLVYETARKRQEEIDRWLKLMQETAVDCALHRKKCMSVEPQKNVKEPRKRMKVVVGGETKFFFVVAPHGAEQPMYKTDEGDEIFGYISFGPPHSFMNLQKEKSKASDLF